MPAEKGRQEFCKHLGYLKFPHQPYKKWSLKVHLKTTAFKKTTVKIGTVFACDPFMIEIVIDEPISNNNMTQTSSCCRLVFTLSQFELSSKD